MDRNERCSPSSFKGVCCGTTSPAELEHRLMASSSAPARRAPPGRSLKPGDPRRGLPGDVGSFVFRPRGEKVAICRPGKYVAGSIRAGCRSGRAGAGRHDTMASEAGRRLRRHGGGCVLRGWYRLPTSCWFVSTLRVKIAWPTTSETTRVIPSFYRCGGTRRRTWRCTGVSVHGCFVRRARRSQDLPLSSPVSDLLLDDHPRTWHSLTLGTSCSTGMFTSVDLALRSRCWLPASRPGILGRNSPRPWHATRLLRLPLN